MASVSLMLLSILGNFSVSGKLITGGSVCAIFLPFVCLQLSFGLDCYCLRVSCCRFSCVSEDLVCFLFRST